MELTDPSRCSRSAASRTSHMDRRADIPQKTWNTVRNAESRSGTDALEVFFLCVMLGFRGDKREENTDQQTHQRHLNS